MKILTVIFTVATAVSPAVLRVLMLALVESALSFRTSSAERIFPQLLLTLLLCRILHFHKGHFNA